MGKNRKNNLTVKFIGIAGPTASGKTSLAEHIMKTIDQDKCIIISQDNYYKDWSRLSRKKRKKINFDDIRAFDTELLRTHLRKLKANMQISMPKYDFIESRRLKTFTKVFPKPVIILEGLIPFTDTKLRSLLDYKIYIATDNSVCLARRIKRDTKERGETIEYVCQRYFHDVLPMQKKYVEPQKKLADIVVDGSKKFDNNLLSNILNHI